MSGVHIDIRNKTFHSQQGVQTVIAGLNIPVANHEFVCLVGPSGCGKTTLLHIIAGLDRDYQGEIRLDHIAAAPKIGYVFQNPRLLPWYSIRRNIELAFAETPPAPLIDSLLSAMQLEEAQHQHPGRLSLGMQRRAAIIRAFAINPDILLMDEPFVSLDAPTARQIRHLLNALWRQRPHTVIFVSHDLREAIALADRIVFLTANPMQIAGDIPVALSRDERNDAEKIETFRRHLLNNYPTIHSLL